MIFGKDEQIRVRIFWVHDNYSIKFFANRFHTSTSLKVFTKIFNKITMLQNLFVRRRSVISEAIRQELVAMGEYWGGDMC